jgi:molecular chaperone DnaK
MAKKFIKIGIDHGTTNSCIAVMEEDGPRVVKHTPVDLVMPSAVYIDRRRRTFVGKAALEAMMTTDASEGTGYTGYKLRIGQDDRYEFAAAREVRTAPQLGATVMGELLKGYREETGEDPKACVITVPAKFEDSACAGTRRAAEEAGLMYYPFVPEPVAAALAYGFTAEHKRAHWVVFDLGGGTLDVSLVIVRDGEMMVPEDGNVGDTRLGGRKFDRELLGYVLRELRKQYALGELSEEKNGTTWGRLMLAVERARTALWAKPEAVVELPDPLCKDARGAEVRVQVPVTRGQYEQLIGPDVERAVQFCSMLLARNRLAAHDVDRMIFVGEASREPYLRQVLQERLGVGLDTSIDPTIAVAHGAAIYGARCEIPQDILRLMAILKAAAARRR